jgi:hypothetical protein
MGKLKESKQIPFSSLRTNGFLIKTFIRFLKLLAQLANLLVSISNLGHW